MNAMLCPGVETEPDAHADAAMEPTSPRRISEVPRARRCRWLLCLPMPRVGRLEGDADLVWNVVGGPGGWRE